MSQYSQHSFSEKVALITDGTNPIGRATAMQLALLGCYVVVGRSNSTELEKNSLEELQSLGTLASSVDIDFGSVEGTKKLIGEVDKLFGRLDLLVNCLKFYEDSEFNSITENEFDNFNNRMLKSTFFAVKESLRLMNSRPSPKIVNALSMCNTEQTQKNVVFKTINSALIGMTESLSQTLPSKFRVNAVAVTEKEKKHANEKLDEDLFRVKKEIDEDDAARTIIYLLSKDSIGINGQVLSIS